jgi:hypothetical protein
MRRLSAAVVLMVAPIALTAVQKNLDFMAVDEALMLVRSGTPSELARFNQPYRVTVGAAPVDYLEVVTPFRAIVLAGSAKRAVGDRSFGQRQALDMLQESGSSLDVYVEMTFNPLNTFIGVPEYQVALAGKGTQVASLETRRISRGTPRFEGPPAVPVPRATNIPLGTRLLGATVIARFDLAAIDTTGTYEVVVRLSGEDVARAPIGLGNMR